MPVSRSVGVSPAVTVPVSEAPLTSHEQEQFTTATLVRDLYGYTLQ
jgi:hypothetical protein